MTSSIAARDLSDDVVELLADRVPGPVLDRILFELAEADRAESSDLRELLEQGIVSAALRQTWPDARGYCLIGIRAEQSAALLSRLSMSALAFRRTVLTCRIGRTLWLLVPTEQRGWAADTLQDPAMPPCLALHKLVSDLRLAPSVRATLEVLLDLGERRGWTGVTHTAELAAVRRMEVLLDLAARQPELLEGQLDILTDDPQNHVLAETLMTWFEHNRDTAAAAAAMHLHVNTVRYRLRRAIELCNLDLTDWDQRLLAELHIRMWQEGNIASSAGPRRPCGQQAGHSNPPTDPASRPSRLALSPSRRTGSDT